MSHIPAIGTKQMQVKQIYILVAWRGCTIKDELMAHKVIPSV